MEMEAIKVLAQFGVPTMVLGFVMWYLIKPLINSFIKNIDQQTDAMSANSQNMAKVTIMLDEMKDKQHDMYNKQNEIHNDIKELKKAKAA